MEVCPFALRLVRFRGSMQAVLAAELPSLSTSLGTRRLARLHMEPEPEPEPEPQPQLELKLRTPYPADVIAPDELQAAVQQLFDVFDVDSSATLTMDEYSMFCLATEGVDCDEERWRSHCQALSADPAIGLHCERRALVKLLPSAWSFCWRSETISPSDRCTTAAPAACLVVRPAPPHRAA